MSKYWAKDSHERDLLGSDARINQDAGNEKNILNILIHSTWKSNICINRTNHKQMAIDLNMKVLQSFPEIFYNFLNTTQNALIIKEKLRLLH